MEEENILSVVSKSNLRTEVYGFDYQDRRQRQLELDNVTAARRRRSLVLVDPFAKGCPECRVASVSRQGMNDVVISLGRSLQVPAVGTDVRLTLSQNFTRVKVKR